MFVTQIYPSVLWQTKCFISHHFNLRAVQSYSDPSHEGSFVNLCILGSHFGLKTKEMAYSTQKSYEGDGFQPKNHKTAN